MPSPRSNRATFEDARPTTRELDSSSLLAEDEDDEPIARDEATDPFPTPERGVPSRAEKRRAAATSSAKTAGKNRYVVWAHGALQRDGVRYEPGESLELSKDEAATIGETVSLSSE